MPHIKLRFSSQSGHPDLLYSQEWVNVIFLHLWPQKLYRAFRFGTLWPISCSYPRHSQLTRHSLMLANGRIRQSLTALVQWSLDKNLFLNTFSCQCVWLKDLLKLAPATKLSRLCQNCVHPSVLLMEILFIYDHNNHITLHWNVPHYMKRIF